MKKLRKLSYYVSMLLMLICSLGILFGHKIEAHLIQGTKQTITIDEVKENQAKNDETYDWEKVSNTNLMTVIQNVSLSNNIVGLVTQPEARVSATLVKGIDNDSLNLSLGTVRPDTWMGKDNFVVTGHHVPQSDWALLSGIYYYGAPDQKVYVTDFDKVYEYTITNVRFVEATDVYIVNKDRYLEEVEGIVPGEPMITLFTCDSTGNLRLAEFGTLTNTYDFDNGVLPKEAVEGFERAANFTWNRNN